MARLAAAADPQGVDGSSAGNAGFDPDSVGEHVALALREHRRRLGLSQRAYATLRGLHHATLSRWEGGARGMSLDGAAQALLGTGYVLCVLDEQEARQASAPSWEDSDLVARDRVGRRFPPHRRVRASRSGPRWWWYHEVLGNKGYGPQPEWTAEGYVVAAGTRHGPAPKPPRQDGLPRWPFTGPS